MSNWLKRVCPKCGDGDQIDVAASVWVRLTESGSDADESQDGDHEYDDLAVAVCRADGCDWSGTVGHLTNGE